MTLSNRLRASGALLPILIFGLALLIFGVLSSTEVTRSFDRIEASIRKLNTIQSLEAFAATYRLRSHQVILEGRALQADLRAARLDMERGLIRLTQYSRDQSTDASNAADMEKILSGVENARRLLELFHAIDMSTARVFLLARDGKRNEALSTFEREVDFRLSTEFSAQLNSALLSEQDTLTASNQTLHESYQRSTIVLAALLAGLLVSVAAALFVMLRQSQTFGPAFAADLEARARSLREANRRLRETDIRRAQFLADVSHELRTPLTILRGEADVALLPKISQDDQRRSLERIQSQAAELAQLLDDLIAFARSDGEPKLAEPTLFLVDDLLATAVEDAENLAEPREIQLRLSLGDKGLWASADPRRLKQALVIGLDNAINHSPPGSEIDVSASRTNNNAVRISIADNGPGLAGDDEERVFERFYRGTDSKSTFGLGIGLSLAKGIVEEHGGSISIANRPEGGAMLTIDLPNAKEDRP